MGEIIDGKKISSQIKEEVKSKIDELKSRGITAGLTAVLVGDHPPSQVYVGMKSKACQQVGINSEVLKFPQDTSEEKLLSLIDDLNKRSEVHGILVQLPLPPQIAEDKVIQRIDPRKDVDGFHPFNVGMMIAGEAVFLPCTPFGIQELLLRSGNDPSGQHVVILGRGNLVGRPLSVILSQKAPGGNATVTLCHSRTKNIGELAKEADILVAAMGKPLFVKRDMVKEGAVVIDVGVNRIDDPQAKKGYRLVGDVDFEGVKDITKAITPVPGGVGPMTVAMLLFNTLKAAKLQKEI
ncbi:MAG: methenyltetrahydrofolate cyclohydrolase [candidate division Zixibacteria bacterium SM23_73_2]|nr:MAG: methenyltetrahydrofolate cyclohydrolase [candidate division Zixibacteria bacterium SM23_73_2]